VVADVASIDLYQEDSASPLTASKPVAFTSGDRLIFSLTEDGGLLSAITLPSGWTLIGTVDASSQRGKAAYHDFAGGEPATWDFAYDGGSSPARTWPPRRSVSLPSATRTCRRWTPRRSPRRDRMTC
jgi:hypothetical protein